MEVVEKGGPTNRVGDVDGIEERALETKYQGCTVLKPRGANLVK